MKKKKRFSPICLWSLYHVQALCVAYMRVGKEFDAGTVDFRSSEEMFLAVVDEYKKIYLEMI